MRLLVVILSSAVLGLPFVARAVVEGQAARAPQATAGLYSADPHHIWNRLHRHLHLRVAADGSVWGDDEVDPLLWQETNYLLTPPSHEPTLTVLDEFLNTDADKLVSDPVKRAVFQHDLWAVFDWAAARQDTHAAARRALETRLARVIRRVALTKDQIAHLPDTYATAVKSGAFPRRADPQAPGRPFLPPDLYDPHGPWLDINDSFSEPIAPQHAGSFSHSEFRVHLTVPGGAAATEAYLKALWDFPEPFVADPLFANDGEQRASLNPKLPPLPRGAAVALTRTMLLVDTAGDIERSTLTESVQLRAFEEASIATRFDQRGDPVGRGFIEFRMQRRSLFSGERGGLQALAPGELAFTVFSSKGIDAFERPPHGVPRGIALQGCPSCHIRQYDGLAAINIAPHLLKPTPRFDYRHPRWSVYAQPALEAKTRRADWVRLRDLWQSSPW